MPISIVFSNLIKFSIQLLIFITFYIYFLYSGLDVNFNVTILYLPILIISMGVLGLGLGMIISSMVTKYRDFTFLIGFGVQLLMYLSAVVYPVDVALAKMQEYPIASKFIQYNPMTTVIESFRKIVFFNGEILLFDLLYMLTIATIVFFIGLLIFNKTEKSFIDTI